MSTLNWNKTTTDGRPIAGNPRDILPDIDASDDRLRKPKSAEGFYKEHVENDAPYTESLAIETSNAQLVVDVPWEYGDLAAYQFLGYSYVVGTQLKRLPPLMHPFYNHLRCRQILNSAGIGWLGYDPVKPQILDDSTPRPYYATYDICRLTMNFVPLPFSIKTDDQIQEGEWERWTWIRTEPGYEALYVEGGSDETGGNYVFDDLCGSTPSGKPVGGTSPFMGGRNIPITMPKLLVTWFDVPTEYISKITTPYYYDNIYAGLQKVNKDAFLGFPPQTLLMDNPIIEPRPNPIPGTISQDPKFLANITFVFHLLNQPAEDVGKDKNGVTLTRRGHNMAIYRDGFKWYPFSRKGTGVDDDLIFKPYDYKKLFKKPT